MVKTSIAQGWKLGVSSALFGGLTEKDLDSCSTAGVDMIEVVLSEKWVDLHRAECEALAKAGEKRGIAYWSAHLPFGDPWDISITDSELRKTILAKHMEYYKLAQLFSVKKLVIHGSYEPVKDDVRSERLNVCKDSLAILSEQADQMGMQLVVECLPRTCIGNTAEEIEWLVQGNPKLGVCCDTNHLLQGTTEDFIRKIGSRITSLHVSDYDRIDEKHWIPGEGVNNWNAIIEALEHTGYDGPIMFEVPQHAGREKITPAELVTCWNKLVNGYLSQQA